MRQIVNIFRKDVRHLRLELIASLAVLLLFCVAEPKAWAEWPAGPATNTSGILVFLLFASWSILILRLVHAERLAGLNQFWTTRPYEWPSLLAAKVGFVLAFVYVPLALAQFYLIHHGGFEIGVNLPLMLLNLVRLTSTFVLPMACIAVVTTSFGQATLSLVGIAAGFASLEVAFSYIGRESATLGLQRNEPLFLIPLEMAIAVVLFSAALLLQYRGRTTRRAIVLLGVTAVLLVATQMVLTGSPAAAAGYPVVVADAPASIAVDAGPAAEIRLVIPKNPRTAVYKIPLVFSDFAPGAGLSRQAKRYTLTAADGYTWTSQWLNDYSDYGGLAPKTGETVAHSWSSIDVPWQVHDRLVGGPVSIRMEFLVSQLKDGAPHSISMETDDQQVPDVGVCALDESGGMVTCRAAFGQSDFVTAKTFGTYGGCDASAGSPPQLVPASGVLRGRMRNETPLPSISPVEVSGVVVRGARDGSPGDLCPGVPMTFTAKILQRRLYLATASATIVLKDRPGSVGP